MDKEIDLSKYQIRTDLTIDEISENNVLKGVESKISTKNNVTITEVNLDTDND